MKEFIFYDRIYSDEELQPYYDLIRTTTEWRNTREYNQSARRMVIYVSDSEFSLNSEIMLKKYHDFIPDKSNVAFVKKFESGFSIDVKVSKYEVSDYFDWHVDEERESQKNPKWKRIITSITYLNDDYEGGTTEFENMIIKPKRGNTLVFPSNWCFPHKGNIIEFGTKYILVNHIWV
jgi:hypothetical protein